MFLQASVCPQEGCLPQCMLGYHIPPPGSRHLPRADIPPGADTPRSRHPPGADTPLGETTTAADGRHPTGMHSCYTGGSGDILDSEFPPPEQSEINIHYHHGDLVWLLRAVVVEFSLATNVICYFSYSFIFLWNDMWEFSESNVLCDDGKTPTQMFFPSKMRHKIHVG